jgi:hypothetical protein
LHQKTLADAALTHQDEIALAANEVAGGQFLDLGPADGGIEIPVEAIEGADLAEARFTNAAFNRSFTALVGQVAQETVDELQVRPAFSFSLFQEGV